MMNVDGKYGFGLAFGGIIGINRGDPADHLSTIFNARGRAALKSSACTVTLVAEYAFRRLSDYTVSNRPYTTRILETALAANSLFSLRTSVPMYDYHTTTDDIVPLSVANKFVAKSCAVGDRIQIVRTPLNVHLTEQVVGAPGAMAFLSRRFGNAAVVNDCTH
jgi:hypothetical protein